MQRWNLPLTILLLAFLGTAAYLSYQVAVQFTAWQAYPKFSEAFNEDNYPPGIRQTSEMLADIREADLYNGQADIGAYYVDLLARNAWNHPDTQVNDLREAIRVSHDVYREYDVMREYLVRWMTYLYFAAGLPTQVDKWESEAVARDPASLEYIRYMQMATRLMSDDIQGARELLESEIGTADTPRPTVAGLAIAGYGLLGEDNLAAGFEAAVLEYGIHDPYFKYSYTEFLIERQRYEDALSIMIELNVDPEKDPDDAQRLALVNAAIYGVESLECQDMVTLGLNTTRRSITRADLEAELYAELYRIDENPAHLAGLFRLAEEHPGRFSILYSFISAVQSCRDKFSARGGDEGDTEPVTPTELEQRLLDTTLRDIVTEAVSVARQPYERQLGQVLHAIVLSQPDPDMLASASDLEDAILSLKRALGDPAVEGSISSQRVPPYEMLLLDEGVIETRKLDPAFDLSVNHAVIDYLNRRRELFADVITTDPLPYKDQTMPATDFPAEPASDEN